jgi:hypothetical protein
MTVLAIEVQVNGNRVVIAGGEDLAVLTASIGAGVGAEKRTLQVGVDQFLLTAMGLTSSRSAARIANLTWINGLPLKVGDSVTFRIVEVEQADPPPHIFRTPTSEELAAAVTQEQRGLTTRSTRTRRKRRAG